MARRSDTKKNDIGRRGVLEQLRVLGDPTLKQQTREVTAFDVRLRALADLMFEVMEDEGGVGLAAPQVGVSSRMMVWKDPDDEDRPYAYVNPYVVSCSEQTSTEEEGCLSVPGVVMEVTRADEVTVKGQDIEGNSFEVCLAGYQARVVQHEIDHLDGVLILDRTSRDERRRVLKELRERSMEDNT
jgi:peptide deformylase